MPTRVKICGITRMEDAQLAVELGAAALGFNFYRRSPRFVSPAAAYKIIQALPPFVMPVGIFADETNGKHVADIARKAGVAAVQLHGPRFPKIDRPLQQFVLIRAVAVRPDPTLDDSQFGLANAYLLDTFDRKLLGGTGKKFDWRIAVLAKRFGPIILAGGLTPANVGRAIRQVRPFAVDVASGVESAPGKKDPAKLGAFLAAVASADRAPITRI